ncbi:AAEL005464-PA [Aedes aegypti]|uniref:AAEL005464-PA n=1 Tax=Aedes aegypti TaxID=7159 RepID=Q179X2_AEDAE|nr:AAEL005464-PA [Aedes aegypti]
MIYPDLIQFINVIRSRSEPRTFPTNSNVRKEPQNLSAEALRREAEFVLAQADRLDRARSRSNSINGGKDDKFNSLPSRKSRGKASLTRSSSDASSKKPQKNLLSLFNKTKHDGSVKPPEEKPRITVSRSKSDVGQPLRQVRDRRTPRRNTQELKNDPLTPIIEASPVEYTKPLDPLTAYAQQKKPFEDSQDLNISTNRATSKPVMETIALLRQNSKSQERLHSSQLPPDKPNLTKGVTVENIVKRLSTERHTSPPPAQIVRDGFSYTRPGEPIVYAQVVCNNDSKEKHTIRNQYIANTSDEDMKKSSPHDDLLDRMATKEYLTMKRPSPPLPKYTLDETDNFPRTKLKPYNSDEDEGLGIDYSKRFSTSYLKTTTTTAADSFTNSDEDHITPTVKYTPPYVGHSYSANYRGQADGKEYFPEFHELSQRREILESRIRNRIGSREVLDIGSPDRDTTTRRGSASRYENYHRTTAGRRSVDRMASASPVRRSTLSPPPVQEDLMHRRNSSNQYVESFVTKTVVNRDGRPYSEEYVERFKYPSKNLEDVRTTRTTFERDGSVERTEVKNFKRNLAETSHSRNVMDKGDSGIENDFRKDSLSSEFPTRKRYSMAQNIHACESFLRHERNHTNSCLRKPKRTYSYRERSIDDGSRFDPRLDDYPDSGRGYRKELKSSLKPEKKTGGLAKVKQFMSSTKKKLVRMGESDKKDSRQSSIRSDERSRYDEQFHSLQVPDIANRRRLSTPKSSPSTTKRSLSFKSTTKTGESSKASRTDWFKSFDRLSRKKPSQDSKSQFGGSDLKSTSGGTKPQKSLRFFGDTDTEYANTAPSRPSRSKSSLSKVDKRYQSAYDLEATPKIRETRNRSTSMQNLDEEDRRNESKRKDLYDISEYSTSYRMRSPSPSYPVRRQHSMNRDYTPDRSIPRKSYSRSRDNSVDRVESDRYQRSSRSRSEQQHRKPPSGPQKPARSFERRGSLTRDTDRIQDSSGTEGESSQQSQRSVVFLHATTVGDIPHPHIANAHRMAYSRESLNSSKKVQPMTRTVSRSVSVLAPWKPKHIRDGYEINYHNDQQQVVKPISTLPRPMRNRSSSQSTLNRTKQKTRRSHAGGSKDDLDSDKSSSFDNSRNSHRPSESGGHQTHSLPRRSRDNAAASGSSKTNTLQKHRRN